MDGNTFSFTITDAAGISYGPFTILAGQCHGAIQVTAGPATITEAAQKPFFLDYVASTPPPTTSRRTSPTGRRP